MPEMKAELARLEEQQVGIARLFNENLDGLRKRVAAVEQAVLELADLKAVASSGEDVSPIKEKVSSV